MGQPQLYGAQLVPWLAQQTLPQGGTLTAAQAQKAHDMATQTAMAETDRATYQAMEALVHNLNTMNSRAGAQVPFSSVNYGTDTSPEGRMVIRNLLLATDAGLGNGETPIFPVQIFKSERGNQLQLPGPQLRSVPAGHRTSAKRLFPNFSFLDAPFQPAILQRRGLQQRSGLHGLPHPGDGQCATTRSGKSLVAGAT